jgi:predicted nucleic acid-binding protein
MAPALDLVIAATAITIDYRLATNKDRHFTPIEGLHLEHWSQPLC